MVEKNQKLDISLNKYKIMNYFGISNAAEKS